MKWNEDLEGREFFEVCQMYRHAKDGVRAGGAVNAAEAFALLKAWIKGDDSNPVLQELATCYRGQ